MNEDVKPIEAILSSLGVELPVEFLMRLDIGQYLDQLDNLVKLAGGERERLDGLLRSARHITPQQFDAALIEQRSGNRNLGDVLISQGVLSHHEMELMREFQHRRTDVANLSGATGHFALGNILVANHEITRAQLEDALRRQVGSGRRVGEELIHAGHANVGQVNNGLSLQRRLVAYALAITAGLVPLAGLVAPVAAGQAHGTMAVSLTVIAEAAMQSTYQAAQLKIAADDVARGFVDVPAASRFAVTSNSPVGYSVEFHSVGKLFDAVQVVGLGRLVQLGADGGAVFVRGALPTGSGHGAMHELNYRFTLTPGTLPGSYPWPLQLSVHALP